MARLLTALGTGLLFGLGLGLSQMVNPAKVLGFLDVAGDWDPSLAFVMAGGLAVTLVFFRPTLSRVGPLFGDRFFVPAKGELDARLTGGSALFGVGWGLVGLCPGPAIASLSYGLGNSLIFIAAMAAGAWLAGVLPTARTGEEQVPA